MAGLGQVRTPQKFENSDTCYSLGPKPTFGQNSTMILCCGELWMFPTILHSCMCAFMTWLRCIWKPLRDLVDSLW